MYFLFLKVISILYAMIIGGIFMDELFEKILEIMQLIIRHQIFIF